MADETATNPVEGGDTAEATAPETQEVEQQQAPELDEEGNPVEPPEPETEEFEFDDGLKLTVPKDQAQKVKDAILRQADYTRKTQELAEQRKALEAERSTGQQASEAEINARAQVVAIDQQLQAFQNIDWDAWEEQDPFAAQKGLRQYQMLKDARANAAGQFVQLQHQRTVQAQQDTARRIQEATAVLAREIEGGWDAKKQAETLEGGIREYKFERSEIESFEDPRMVIALVDALKWRAHLKTQKQAQKHVDAQQAQPAAKVGRASPPPQGLDDRVNTDEWMRRRNAQTRRRA